MQANIGCLQEIGGNHPAAIEAGIIEACRNSARCRSICSATPRAKSSRALNEKLKTSIVKLYQEVGGAIVAANRPLY